MLFSQPELASFMSGNFECAWESVRPVPHLTLDFGDGHVLERTLRGNIVTYLCTADGQVFDLIPGLVDAPEYARRLDQALRLLRAWMSLVMSAPEPSSTGSAPLIVLGQPPKPWRDLVTRWHEGLVARAQRGETMQGDPIPVPDLSKARVENRLLSALASTSTSTLAEADAAALKTDTLVNRTERYPLASQLLLEHPFARPAEIRAEVYRRVLHVDLDDPYLGLAPDVLGGEPGRH